MPHKRSPFDIRARQSVVVLRAKQIRPVIPRATSSTSTRPGFAAAVPGEATGLAVGLAIVRFTLFAAHRVGVTVGAPARQ